MDMPASNRRGHREFEDALRERGWVSGRNIAIEHRAEEGRSERLRRHFFCRVPTTSSSDSVADFPN